MGRIPGPLVPVPRVILNDWATAQRREPFAFPKGSRFQGESPGAVFRNSVYP